MKEKSFAVYGLKAPPVMRVLPTNLPAIEANELRMDHLFELKDGSIALVRRLRKNAFSHRMTR